jgi:hypothetical protein
MMMLSKQCHLSFRAFFCIFLSLFLFFSFFNGLNHDVKKVSASAGVDILFEPYNAALMPESGITYIPFIAGLVSDGQPSITFVSIDVYALKDDVKEFQFNYLVNTSLYSCYLDGYYAGTNTKQVKSVESECLFEDPNYILDYDETLKEAIGFSGSNDQELVLQNETVLNKVYDSLDDSKMIELNIVNIFDDFEAGDLLVFVLKGNFLIPSNPEPIERSIEREITIYVTMNEDDIGSSTPTDIGGFDKRFRDELSFYKGDGHIHSRNSDGMKDINHTRDANKPQKLKTIAHYRREVEDMDWLIFTDHAKCFWEGQSSGYNSKSGSVNFEDYHTRCNEGNNSAQFIEREETETENYKNYFQVIPGLEVSVTTEDTSCDDNKSNNSHVLNYYCLHANERVKRWPDWRINGTDFVKDKAGDNTQLPCYQEYTDKGPDGWCVIAHPHKAYGWKFFPQTENEWTASWGSHKSPSIIRSFEDLETSNNGKGIMGMEINTNGDIDTSSWDKYLYYDLTCTVNHWNEDTYKNNFMIGFGNSDSHQNWWYPMEDLTGLKKAYLSGVCPIITDEEAEAREVPYFENIPYWYATFEDNLFSKGCSFVYCDNPPYTRSDLLEAMRACGKDNKGVTASSKGSFATFDANGTRSGGFIDGLGTDDVTLHIFAYPLLRQLGRITKITVYGKGSSGPTPRVVWSSTYASPVVKEMSGWEITISNDDIETSDYLRVNVEFDLWPTGNESKPIKDIAICNPVFLKK